MLNLTDKLLDNKNVLNQEKVAKLQAAVEKLHSSMEELDKFMQIAEGDDVTQADEFRVEIFNISEAIDEFSSEFNEKICF